MQRAVAESVKDAEEDERRAGQDRCEDGEEGDYAEGFDSVEVFFRGVGLAALIVAVVVVVVATVTVSRALLPTYTLIPMVMTLALQQCKTRLIPHNMNRRNRDHKADPRYRRPDQE